MIEGDTPPADPATDAVYHQRFEIPLNAQLTGRRVVRQFLEERITLEEGQRLLVSVSLIASGDEHLCVAVCEDTVSAQGREFWSNAATPPFAWADMKSFGINAPFIIEATGDVSEE